MIDPIKIINKYYADNRELQHILLTHSCLVTNKALKIAEDNPKLNIDKSFIYEAGMLHDIGIFQTDSPRIFCFGEEHYLCHGVLGAKILREEGLEAHARVCERHTGTGLTKKNIIDRHLPLPQEDLFPETIEEQLICYADKFYSKTKLTKEKKVQKIINSLRKYGDDGVLKFLHWLDIFG